MLTAVHKNLCGEVGKTISGEVVLTTSVSKSNVKHYTLTATSSEYRKNQESISLHNFTVCL